MATYFIARIILPIWFAGALFSQTTILRGTVSDATRGPIAGAKVTATLDGKTSGSFTLSDPKGEFSLSLEPGKYKLTISKESFLEVSQGVDVLPGTSESRTILLELAPVQLSVTVTDSARYLTPAVSSATKTLTPLRDVPQSITVIQQEQIRDQMMLSIGDAVRYVPGITPIQGENNRDQLVIRGNSTSADFFLNGVRDDVQFYRDLYNLERLEALKGPNAMEFGRGGGGGVINRVTKEAIFSPIREISLLGGSFGDKRVSADIDQPWSGKAAFRINGMFENSGSFRDHVGLERYGISPTLTYAPSKATRILLGYENFSDTRGADRGIPSFQGRPLDVGISQFFGNPAVSNVHAVVNSGSALLEHQIGGLNVRNRTLLADYDRGYQNFVPGAVSADKTRDTLTAYNNATARRNIFNQTDLTYSWRTGSIKHTLLAGVEVGRQLTGNFRNTGYFNNTDTSIQIPLSNTVIGTPITFRQSATDADNRLRTNLGATYVQDQVQLSRFFQVIAGARFDHFDLRYFDNRSGNNLAQN